MGEAGVGISWPATPGARVYRVRVVVLPAVQTVILDVDRDDLPEGGDPGTGRFQLRASPIADLLP